MNNNINNLMIIFKGIVERQKETDTLISDTLKNALLAYKDVFGSNVITFEGIERVEVLFGGKHNTKMYSSFITEVEFDNEGALKQAKVSSDDVKCQWTYLFGVYDEYEEPNVLMCWEENLLSMVLNKLGKKELGKGVVEYLVEK